MRWLPLVLLLGCSSPTPAAIVVDDAGVAAETDAAPPEDASSPVAPACTEPRGVVVYGTPCEGGGYLYGLYGGTCPVGDVGNCRLVSKDNIGNYAEACCERLACARNPGPTDGDCDRAFDGGLPEGWNCPDEDAGPPAGCAPVFPGATEYCCPRP